MKIIEVTNVDFSLRHFLLPLMRALRDAGHEAIGVAAEGRLLDDARAEGFRIVAVPFVRSLSLRASLLAFRALVALFRAERPDMVHAHMPISGLLARAAAWWVGVPVIAYTCHGFVFNQPNQGLLRPVSLVLEWLAGRVTHRFLTVSSAEARQARRLWIARRAEAAGNGRDPRVFHPDPVARQRVRVELGVPADAVVVAAVSRLVRMKGYPELAAAMRQVPDAQLWVVGERLESDRGEDMVALLDNAGLGGRLRRLGYRTDVAAILAASDLFVLPSFVEGQPMSVIEAMLTGLPVVASDLFSTREQVVDGQTGLLVPAGDADALAAALNRLVGDPDVRAAMGAAGQARALALFDERKVLARTLDLLGVSVYPAPHNQLGSQP